MNVIVPQTRSIIVYPDPMRRLRPAPQPAVPVTAVDAQVAVHDQASMTTLIV